jgi:hypothetical protein
MRKTSKGDLIRYIYREMDSLESRMFEKSMESDPELTRECRELQQTRDCLEGLHARPRHQVLRNILAHAAETRIPPVSQA